MLIKLCSSGEKLQTKVQLKRSDNNCHFECRRHDKGNSLLHEAFENIIRKCKVTICNNKLLLKSNYKIALWESAAVSSTAFIFSADGMHAYVNSNL